MQFYLVLEEKGIFFRWDHLVASFSKFEENTLLNYVPQEKTSLKSVWFDSSIFDTARRCIRINRR